jgi:DNA invertase Pin-like site-specific DNA recombinase
MPKFYGYGRASTDKQIASPEVQCEMTRLEFEHQKKIGIIPDMEWGGFFADGNDLATSRAVKFLHRPMGIHLATIVQPGDKVCVTALDRLLGSSSDAEATIEFFKSRNVGLVIMDMRGVDSSNSIGQLLLETMCAFKAYERREIGRRTKEAAAHRRRNGLPVNGSPPIGYKNRRIVPLGGGRAIKYYLPWDAEQNFCRMIVDWHDNHGISFARISTKVWKEKIKLPRTGKRDINQETVSKYYFAAKNGFPLHDGVQWKPPSFTYRLADTEVITDFNRVSA